MHSLHAEIGIISKLEEIANKYRCRLLQASSVKECAEHSKMAGYYSLANQFEAELDKYLRSAQLEFSSRIDLIFEKLEENNKTP